MTSLTLVRRMKAPPARVYDALTRPELMMHWWRPDNGPVLSAEADVRPGGAFRVVFRMEDGELRDCNGVYREVEPERRLVFTWYWADAPEAKSLVTIGLRPTPEGTELDLTHDRLDTETARASHLAGWEAALDKLQDAIGANA